MSISLHVCRFVFFFFFLCQGLWKTIPPLPKILGDTNTETLASVLNVAGISCTSLFSLCLVFFFQFYPSTLNVSLEMIPSDSSSPAAQRILLPAQEQLDTLCMPARLKPTDYFMGEDGRGETWTARAEWLNPCTTGSPTPCIRVVPVIWQTVCGVGHTQALPGCPCSWKNGW